MEESNNLFPICMDEDGNSRETTATHRLFESKEASLNLQKYPTESKDLSDNNKSSPVDRNQNLRVVNVKNEIQLQSSNKRLYILNHSQIQMMMTTVE